MSEAPQRPPAPTPISEATTIRARRQRRRRIRTAVQLVVSAAAIWFVTHPSAFPTVPDTDPLPGADSSSTDGSRPDGSISDSGAADSLGVPGMSRDSLSAAGGPALRGSTTPDSPLGARRRQGAPTGTLDAPFSHLPSSRLLPSLPRLLPRGRLFRSIQERARAGERIAVSVTAYCLDGTTRTGNRVRAGIIAVDRSLFPLGRDVELFFGRKSYGRFKADDTGGAIRGGRIDVWMPDCSAARRFGRRRGFAQLVQSDP